MIIVEVLILVILWLTSCAGCAAVGFYCAAKKKRSISTVADKTEPTEQERRKAKRSAKEMANFYAYDGTEQNELIDTE